MADTDDMNLIRVGVLGRSVDDSNPHWTTGGPAANRNALDAAITERVVTRLLNNFNGSIAGAVTGTNDMAERFNSVVGDEILADKDEFDTLGNNLIQIVGQHAATIAELEKGGAPGDAVSIHGRDIDDATPNDGDTLVWSAAQNRFVLKQMEGGGKMAWVGFIGAPPPGSLEPLELAVEYDAEPNPRIWIGVPLSVDATGRRILYPPISLPPPTEAGTIWDDGNTLWDVHLGGTLWDVPTLWYDNGVLTVWDNGTTRWDY